MINNSKSLMKRIAFLLCLMLSMVSMKTPLLARNYEENDPFASIILEETPIQVTTEGGYELTPLTTPQSVEVKWSALEETVQATTGSMIQLELEVGGVSHINLFELELEYDESQIIYVEETLSLEGSILISKEIKDGKVKLVFGTNKVQDLQHRKKVIEFKFKTQSQLQEGDTIQIKLKQCNMITINEADETQMIEGINQSKIVTIYVIEEEPTPDLNKDGIVTLEDLSIAMKYYSKDSTQTLWEKAKKCDVVQDERIDMADLIAIRSAIK